MNKEDIKPGVFLRMKDELLKMCLCEYVIDKVVREDDDVPAKCRERVIVCRIMKGQKNNYPSTLFHSIFYNSSCCELLTDEKQMPIYISGPIESVGVDKASEAFKAAEEQLKEEGYTLIINPMEVISKRCGPNASWSEAMVFDIRYLALCRHILMLPGWEQSVGSRIEHEFAKHEGLNIIYL